MVIPLLIEVNPTRVTKSARMFLRAGMWRILTDVEGNYKLTVETIDPPSQESCTYEKNSKEFKGPCYAQVEILSSKATNLNILAERY